MRKAADDLIDGEINIRIADAIENQAGMYSQAATEFLPFVDVLRLVDQKPEILSILHWPEKGPREVVYTTQRDWELAGFFVKNYLSGASQIDHSRCVPLGDEYYLVVHDQTEKSGELSYTQGQTKRLQGVIEYLKNDSIAATHLKDFNAHLRGLRASGDAVGDPAPPTKDANAARAQWRSETAEHVIKALRAVITDAISGDSHDSLLRRRADGGKMPFRNFYIGPRFSIPYRRVGCFDYTSQLVIPHIQREEMVQWLKPGSAGNSAGLAPDQVIKDLEQPLGIGARAIVDSAFCSGVVEFAPERPGKLRDGNRRFNARSGRFEPSPPSASDGDDHRRRAAERIVYGGLGEGRLFCVPIHVGGIAYMTAFTFAPLHRNRNDWLYPYRFYCILPLIAARIRLGVHQAYCSAIGHEIEKTIESGAKLDVALEEINRRWRELAYFFPYELPVLRKAVDRDVDPIHMPEIGAVAVSLASNPNHCFSSPMNFDRLSKDDIVSVCREVADAQRHKFLELSHAEITHAQHEVSNLIVPAYSDLQWTGTNGDLDLDSRYRVQQSLRWLSIMGASARARTELGRVREQALKGGAQPRPIFKGRTGAEVRLIVEAALQYLLASHAAQLAAPGSTTGSIDLNYRSGQGERLSPEAAFDRLRDCATKMSLHRPGGRGIPYDLEVLYCREISWPIGLLREVVQNIRLDTPLRGQAHKRIDFVFDWRADGGGHLVLETRQTQRQFGKMPAEPPDGLERANRVYGAQGARFGEVALNLKRQVKVAPAREDIYDIDYRLSVTFYCPELQNVGPKVEGNKSGG